MPRKTESMEKTRSRMNSTMVEELQQQVANLESKLRYDWSLKERNNNEYKSRKTDV